ncbi:chemotaxis protein CheC [Halorussus halobius]|uniref:chemotaxis protein CheC n=1 Tax=Halorussus halobius TaxID=1710537 RepID=UPI001093226D|nr:chemotaxis protein CheC [Halorussus halobius]
MNVDVESLGSVSRTAREGAERAADNLAGMTGIDARVDVTAVTLASFDDLAHDDERVGVEVDLSGGIEGASLLTFSPSGADALLDALVPGADATESAIAEVGNVVTSGFVDGWADHLGTIVDVSPPAYVEGTGAELLEAAGVDPDRALAFRSEVVAVGEALDVEFHMFPDPESMREVLGADDGVAVEKLVTLREMGRAGARTASESVSAMTGIDACVDVTRLSFVPVEDVPGNLSDARYVGVVLELDGPFGGYVMILFDEASAREVVDALVPGEEATDSFDGMARSAMTELGNVMTSSFVDGWANVLDATIDISTPQFVHDMGGAIAESVVARLGRRQANAVLFDAALRADDRTFDCELYVLPDETEFRDALDDIDVDDTAERTTKAGSL